MADVTRTGFLILAHSYEQIRDAWIEGDTLILRQIVLNATSSESAVRTFRLSQPEYVKIAELIAALREAQAQGRAQVAVAGE